MELLDVAKQVGPYCRTWLEHQRDFSVTPGVQVAIRVGDELAASFALGVSDVVSRRDLTTSHLFHVASHSKTFTATAVLQLVEAGRLRLDDLVGSWVPELEGSPAATYTIRELLGHQSGINRDGSDSDYWQLLHEFPDRDELIGLARADAVFAPNEHFKYSNIGYSLLGLVVEAASGQPYGRYVTSHIIDPLHLVDTGPEVPRGRRKDLAGAHGIRLHAKDVRPLIDDVPTHSEQAATGFYSTAEEVSRYMACHAMGREELLSDASKRLMQRRESRITRGGERFYGLGLILKEVDDRLLVGHSGGWPGHITHTWLDPKTGLCVSVLANCLGAPATTWCTEIVRLVDMVFEAEQQGPAAAVEGVDPGTFTGRYAAMWGVDDIVLLGSRLYEVPAATGSPRDDATELEVVDSRTLRAEPEDSFGATGEDLLFTFKPKGAVKHVRAGGSTMWPIKTYEKRVAAQRPA